MLPALPLPLFPTTPLARSALLATCGSAVLLLTALGFEHIGGLRPCDLCHWQRYGHLAVVVFGLGALVGGGEWRAVLFGFTLAALFASAGLALYHVGVEWKWWQGPQSCSGSMPRGLSLEELRRRLMGTPVVRCDEIPWSLFGLSMAGWNFLWSASLAIMLSVAALRRREVAA